MMKQIKHKTFWILLAGILLFAATLIAQSRNYLWVNEEAKLINIVRKIPPPAGFVRVPTSPGSFPDWLRGLPLKKGSPPVRLYTGDVVDIPHAAVLAMNIGQTDLLQCADIIIRLRAEYLFEKGRTNLINFRFHSGHLAEYEKWVEGYRPIVNGNKVVWKKTAPKTKSYKSFQKYLNTVYMYASTYSLADQLTPVSGGLAMRIGDVFIQKRHPSREILGHAELVVDMAENKRTGEKVFLLMTGYTPARDIYIPANPSNAAISPWYHLENSGQVRTPEWRFTMDDLKRFP